MLPRGSCAALNLNISLELKGIRISGTVYILGTNKTGLRVLLRIKDGTVTVEIGVSV
jgi:hypothetical protein